MAARQANLYAGLRAKDPAAVRAILERFLEDKNATRLDLRAKQIEALPGAYFAARE
jgi:hypothetical protein